MAQAGTAVLPVFRGGGVVVRATEPTTSELQAAIETITASPESPASVSRAGDKAGDDHRQPSEETVRMEVMLHRLQARMEWMPGPGCVLAAIRAVGGRGLATWNGLAAAMDANA